eukprot:COSAG01_NODE_41_length_32446_cov_41.218877_38_plen_108_part_00
MLVQPILRPGLIITAVGDFDVSAMSVDDVKGSIAGQRHVRPIQIKFREPEKTLTVRAHSAQSAFVATDGGVAPCPACHACRVCPALRGGACPCGVRGDGRGSVGVLG